MGPYPPQTVLIIGGGEFGLACAEELANTTYKGHANLITVVDRSATPPSVDAASSDLNKIVRSDYSDLMYSSLAKTAIAKWSDVDEPYAKDYHQSGTLILSSTAHATAAHYVRSAFDLNDGAVPLETAEKMRDCFPSTLLEKGAFVDQVAYFNPNCGYTTARSAMDALCDRVRQSGVKFLQGQATRILYDSPTSLDDSHDDITKRTVVGVELASGKILTADLYIISAGAWTSTLIPELADDLLASGQVVGTIQLTEEEAQTLKGTPVVLAMDTGFYVFPPNEEHVFKFAIHGAGYLNPTSSNPSVPRTTLSEGGEHDNIPREAVLELKKGLARVYPMLAEKKWVGSRLCWYTDSPSSHWLIDYLSPNLFVASAGSGHAFKFLPLMGSLVAGSLYGRLPPDQAKAWSFAELTLNRKGDSSRGGSGMGERKVLRVEDMITTAEL